MRLGIVIFKPIPLIKIIFGAISNLHILSNLVTVFGSSQKGVSIKKNYKGV